MYLFFKKPVISCSHTYPFSIEEHELIALLPTYQLPKTLLISDYPPGPEKEITRQPIEQLTTHLNRLVWAEGLHAKQSDLARIKRYKYPNGCYQQDFDALQFLTWVKTIESNAAVCTMPLKALGKSVFVPPGKKYPKARLFLLPG